MIRGQSTELEHQSSVSPGKNYVLFAFRLQIGKDNGKWHSAEISCVTNSIFHASMELSLPLAKRHIDNQHFHSISKDLLSYYRILTLIKHMYFKAATSKMEYPRKRKVCWPMAKRAFDYSSLCFLKIYTKEIEMHDYWFSRLCQRQRRWLKVYTIVE